MAKNFRTHLLVLGLVIGAALFALPALLLGIPDTLICLALGALNIPVVVGLMFFGAKRAIPSADGAPRDSARRGKLALAA